ncbi:hypothetical protein AMTRI_Chr08g164220 [Amborella trichopoda]
MDKSKQPFGNPRDLFVGKILSKRVNRLTLKQQRLITIAIKKKQFERTESIPRITGIRTIKK